MKKKWELRHCDLDLWPKVTKFNRVRASAGISHLVKTASKSVHPFGWNFVHKNSGHTDRQTHTHTDRHTHRHTDKLKWKYNPSTISWRCKKKCFTVAILETTNSIIISLCNVIIIFIQKLQKSGIHSSSFYLWLLYKEEGKEHKRRNKTRRIRLDKVQSHLLNTWISSQS